MLGPIAIDDFGDDPFAPPAGVGDGTAGAGGGAPNAVLAWQERQRRQRTVRLLMMFLMMLLLMDGEEPSRRRRESNIHLRHGQRGKRRGKSGNGPEDGEQGGPMDAGLFAARWDQDERVREAARLDHRFYVALRANGGVDFEGTMREWAKIDIEKAEALTAAYEADDEEGAAEAERVAAEREKSEQFLKATATGDGLEGAYHYPRNATGYYRGDWTRLDEEGDASAGAKNRDEPAGGGIASDSKNGPAVDGLRLADEDEIEPALKQKLRELGDPAAVLLLPPGLALRSEAEGNETLFPMSQGGIEPAAYLRSRPSAAYADESAEANKVPSLSLTRKSGRTAFQLYARRIPAMTELSLVEGYVKLYDGSNSAFAASTKRDVLLRVRGVLVHAIGRMSLVANAAPGRSALVIDGTESETVGEAGADEDSEAEGGGELLDGEADEDNEEEVSKNEKEGEAEEDKRRRLRAAVAEYLAPSFGGDGIAGSSFGDDIVSYEGDDNIGGDGVGGRVKSAGLLEQIRDDALSLLEDTDSLGRMKSLWHERSNSDGDNTYAAGWSLSSPDLTEVDGGPGDLHGFDELLYGEPSRQMAELVGSYFTPTEGGQESSSGWWPSPFSGRRALQAVDDKVVLATDKTMVPDVDATEDEDEQAEVEFEFREINSEAKTDEVQKGSRSVEEEEVEDEVEKDAAEEDGAGEEVLADETYENTDKVVELVKLSEDGSPLVHRQRRTSSTEKRVIEMKEKSAPRASEKQRKKPGRVNPVNSDVQPYPYALDDSGHALGKPPAHLKRPIPHREQLLEANGLGCEFELLFDVAAIRWSVEEWRAMAWRHARGVRELDPRAHAGDGSRGGTGGKQEKRGETSDKWISAAANARPNSEYRGKKSRRTDSLAMQLNGTVISPNCGFRSAVNVTAIRTDWEHTTGKAINYSFYMMLTCLTQIVVLLRQLLHTQSPSAATRVSLVCVGWQTVLDAVLCVGHIFLCLVMQPLFTAFASVAFFKLLIFCVIEMKYMAIIIQARHNAANNNNNSAEELRRQVALLHLRFYGALMLATAAFWIAGSKHRTLYILFLYSFWVPQIIRNVITEAKKPLHPYFIYGMSVTRLVAPMYMFAVPNNFMKEVNPDFPTDLVMCELLILWVGVQAAVLVAQGKYGARFMIPALFLPPKYDYNRPIPPSMLPPVPPADTTSSQNGSETTEQVVKSSSASDLTDGTVKQRGPRNRLKGKGAGGKSSRRRNARDKEVSKGTMTVSEPVDNGGGAPRPTLDCVICYNDIDVSDRMGYMMAPCDHIFHRSCLEQWMDVKMECPICRKELPSLGGLRENRTILVRRSPS